MNLKISQSIRKSQQLKVPDISLLTELISREQVEEVLGQTGKVEQRKRKLPSEWVIWICIVMSWLPRHCMQAVLAKLWCGISLGGSNPTEGMASASAITQARYRLGVKPLEQLFKRVCRPQASQATEQAFYQGMRLVAFDGTKETVADSPQNARYFGYNKSQRGAGAYPQLRTVYACELGTHIIFDAVVGACYRGEHPMACRLLRSVESDMLVMVDAGLSSYELISGVLDAGGHVLARSHASRQWHPLDYLKDGSFLAWMASSKDPHAPHILVRVLRYTLDDETRPHHGEVQTLVTTLLDPDVFPACQLIVLYHERWEIELTIDEMDTHQRLANRPFRSLKPLGVLQEFYAFLIAYFLIRLIMLRTAQAHHLDPDSLSFTNSIHLIVDALPLFQLVAPPDYPQLWQWLMDWIVYFQLPPRRDRSNPRVVKRTQSRFPRKQVLHLHVPPPTTTFSEAIVMLT